MDALYELKDMLCEELEEYGRKDKMDLGGLDIVDKLAHTIKNLDKIIENYEDEDGYSGMGRIYAREERAGSMRRGSYSRAKREGARRDSMGRYSGDARMIIPELRDLMNESTDERMKGEMQRFIQRIESM